ncbi:3-oxoacyl-ACP reductase [Rhodococcus sp. 1163]|uniref:3-oxoacyl-ACP reductase n=1 Tax=unclassified Rhodococcus (in: high G+C Gram-positive bacteria) TaxID=192944 RepID=UPI0009FF48B5|nr:3-oxoacyl-ACP reductase [Rhodococcus sp. 1163]ORI16817.1 3-oxoacyl-ACP reductase [Rhodococcus sp. 1163]
MQNIDLSGRSAIITGAGSGLGRAEALGLAALGASVVVNDVGPAGEAVAREIETSGGRAVAVLGDVSDWSLGERLVEAAVTNFGSLDIVVNNAGITRDTMLFNMTEKQWDDVIAVHLKGHASVSRAAAVHWRSASKAIGGPVYGRVINTASEAFLLGGAGQANYAAAKAGIVALTLSTARGLSRYGVTANAICPRARTEMTAAVFGEGTERDGLDIMAPERVATCVSFLAAPAAEKVNGQVFIVYGDMVALMAPPVVQEKFVAANGSFSVAELAEQVVPYIEDLPEGQSYAATSINALDTTGAIAGGQ